MPLEGLRLLDARSKVALVRVLGHNASDRTRKISLPRDWLHPSSCACYMYERRKNSVKLYEIFFLGCQACANEAYHLELLRVHAALRFGTMVLTRRIKTRFVGMQELFLLCV